MGTKGHRFSDEYRENMSRVAKERSFGKWMKGRKLTPEHCANISRGYWDRWPNGKPQTEAQVQARERTNQKRSEESKQRMRKARAAYLERGKPKLSDEDRRQYGKIIARAVYHYGMEVEDFKHIWERSNGQCEMCQGNKPLVIDHDHKSGLVRGLLCQHCNAALGQIEQYQKTARVYLEKIRQCSLS